MSTELWRCPHMGVRIDRAAALVRIERTALAFTSPEEVESVWRESARVLDRERRPKLALLVDLRAAPGRNDPAFEAAMIRVRPLVMRDFRRTAILISTGAGLLQIKRHIREDGIERMVGSDEAELVAYLTERPA